MEIDRDSLITGTKTIDAIKQNRRKILSLLNVGCDACHFFGDGVTVEGNQWFSVIDRQLLQQIKKRRRYLQGDFYVDTSV
ncbi:MAG: hypothetical protein AAF821_25095 [Cyanobacteria bacterium P01_D01_bin.156]